MPPAGLRPAPPSSGPRPLPRPGLLFLRAPTPLPPAPPPGPAHPPGPRPGPAPAPPPPPPRTAAHSAGRAPPCPLPVPAPAPPHFLLAPPLSRPHHLPALQRARRVARLPRRGAGCKLSKSCGKDTPAELGPGRRGTPGRADAPSAVAGSPPALTSGTQVPPGRPPR